MKSSLKLFLCMLLITAITIPVFADLIWEPGPEQDKFFEKHRSECTYVGSTYYVNAESGYAMIYTEPNGEVFETAGNSYEVFVMYLYNDWALVDGNGIDCGWMILSDLLKVYDYQDYLANHPLQEEPEDIVWGEVPDGYFVLWDYPGSVYHRLFSAKVDDEDHVCTMACFKDYIQGYCVSDNGLVYGYIGYFYGHQDAFVCISDPVSEELPVNEIVQDLIPCKDGFDGLREYKSNGLNVEMVTAVVLCSFAVLVSVVLLILFKRKRRSVSA